MDCLAPLDDPAFLSVLAYFASSLVMIPLNREVAAAHPYTFIRACFATRVPRSSRWTR